VSIYQISKIQHRRGNRTELPQLSAAELGWAVDSQELFIGNGSVSEGAPAIGNTKVLTEHDDLLQLIAQYQYKLNFPYIWTRPNGGSTKRSLQDRLDDWVSNLEFSIIPNDPTDQGPALQNALYTLFANTNTIGDPTSRVTLNVLPGEYTISTPVYIPSYTTLVGAGIDKTIFKFTGNGQFIFVRDNINVPVDEINQPKYCVLSDFSIYSEVNNISLPYYYTPMIVDTVRNSAFNNIKIKNTNYTALSVPFGLGMFFYSPIDLPSLPATASFNSNIFNNITIENFELSISSTTKFTDNIFTNFDIRSCTLGVNTLSYTEVSGSYPLSIGIYSDTTGSHNNLFENFKLNNVSSFEIILYGTKNTVRHFRSTNKPSVSDPYLMFISRDNLVDDYMRDGDDILNSVTSTYDYITPNLLNASYTDNAFHSIDIPADTDIVRFPSFGYSTITIDYTLAKYQKVRNGQLSLSIYYDVNSDRQVTLTDDFSSNGSALDDVIFTAKTYIIRVLNYNSFADFPSSSQDATVYYYDLSTNTAYVWDGTTYVVYNGTVIGRCVMLSATNVPESCTFSYTYKTL